jgi:hypothetical protein
VDGDGAGDVCDDFDGMLDIRRASLRESDRQRGRIIVRGDIVLSLPDDEFDASEGVAIQLLDGAGMDFQFVWTPDECTELMNGRVICRDATRQFQGRFNPTKGDAGRVRFAITFKKLNLAGPIAPPLMLVITDGPAIPVVGVDRVGMINDCRVTKNGMVCRIR